MDSAKDLWPGQKSPSWKAHCSQEKLETNKDSCIKMLERKYTIPLRKKFLRTQKYRRGYKSMKIIKEFLGKHMKVSDVRLGRELNEEVLKYGRENPPSKVEVKVIKFEEKGAEPYVKANLVTAEIKVEKEKKSIAGKLKDKLTAKPDEEKTAFEKEKHEVLEHAELSHKKDHVKLKLAARKASPKAEGVIGETGKKVR